mgnify:FL=1
MRLQWPGSGSRVARAALLPVVLAAFVLTACSSGAVVSDASTWGTASRDTQSAWIGDEVDTAIQAVGQPSGWWEFDEDEHWPEERTVILEQLRTESCRPSRAGEQPGRLGISLHHSDIQDPCEAAERVRTRWMNQGWTVTDVLESNRTNPSEIYFRADRADGALLTFDANKRIVRLQVWSACSQNNTV